MSLREWFGRTPCWVTSLRTRATLGCCIATIMLGAVSGCGSESSLERLMEARRLSAELLVQFTKAADAAHLAVMADTDETSAAFGREAEQAMQTVQRDTDALEPVLMGLGYSAEARLLEEFAGRFAEYQALEREILGLAVENTNLKAQRLSFGPVQKEADAFGDSLESIARSSPAKDSWQVKALTATALSAVREIQVLQAPHIAEPEDAAMTRIEKQMATSEALARSALEMLMSLVPPASRPQLAAATATLDRFADLNRQLIALSRRNSDVRSLALSLGRKRMLTARCEDSLRALQDELSKRGFTGTR